MSLGQNVTRTKCHSEKMSQDKMSQDKMSQDKMSQDNHLAKLNKIELSKMSIFWDVRLARDTYLRVASCELRVRNLRLELGI